MACDPEARQVLEASATLEDDRVEHACGAFVACLKRQDRRPDPKQASEVLAGLRTHNHVSAMKRLADQLIRLGCRDDVVYRQYGQGLIETGELIAALELLDGLARRASPGSEEWNEAQGLLGRAYKQIYVDAAGCPMGMAEDALHHSVAAYRRVFDKDTRQIWHGVNLVALLARAERDGISVPDRPDKAALVDGLRREIEGRWSAGELKAFDYATAAELALARRDKSDVRRWLKEYLASSDADAFSIASTLRQFREVWGLTADDGEGGAILAVLRTALLQKRFGALNLSPEQVQRTAAADLGSLEKILGDTGLKTFGWMKLALQRARAVALIRQPDGRGIGTGFLLQGKDLHPPLGDELYLLTNAHVVSDLPEQRAGVRSDEATAAFEATAEPGRTAIRHRFSEIIWNSPPELLDATLLRFAEPLDGIEPCPVARNLPLNDGDQRLYVIGHPLGGELSFSIQDNRLLDHEGPQAGHPTVDGRVLLHYRAPTEPGSSGSPVFSEYWEVIGVHHAGGDFMPKLNRKPGTYAANEGIWIRSIAESIKDSGADSC
jgi:S1-C subfamily serine protease